MERKVRVAKDIAGHVFDVFKIFWVMIAGLVLIMFSSNEYNEYIQHKEARAIAREIKAIEALAFTDLVEYWDIYPASCGADPDNELPEWDCVAPIDTKAEFWSDSEIKEAVVGLDVTITWEEKIRWDSNPDDDYVYFSQWAPVNTTSHRLTKARARRKPELGEKRTGFASNYPHAEGSEVNQIVFTTRADYILESDMCLTMKHGVKKCITKRSRVLKIR